MKAHVARLTPFLALLASACGASDDEPTLNHYGDEVSEAVDAVEAALSLHHEAVLAETDLERMLDMEEEHMTDMAMPMGSMQDAQDSMERCGEHMTMAEHAGSVANYHDARTAMTEAMAETDTEMAHHMQAMHEAVDVDAALAQEHQHQAIMDQLLDRMRMHDGALADAMQAMEDEGMSMMCPMNSHMHRQH